MNSIIKERQNKEMLNKTNGMKNPIKKVNNNNNDDY